MTSALVERAACSALFWSQSSRRDAVAVLGAVAGLSDAEREAVADLIRGKTLSRLSDPELLERMTELATKTTAGSVLLEPATGDAGLTVSAGSFAGYAWRWDVIDRQGEMIARGAFAESAARINSGYVIPLLVGGHEWDDVQQVAGAVTAVAEDEIGLRIEGRFTTDPAGQALRAKAVAGAPVGLSIGGPIISSRPLPGGARELLKVDLLHVTTTNSPAHPGAAITAAKEAHDTGGDVAQELTRLEEWARGQADADALAAMVDNPVGMVHAAQLLVGTETGDELAELEAWAATVRIPTEDEVRQESARVRRDVNNRVSREVHEMMSAPAPAGGCGRCQRCRVGSECIYG